MAALAPDAVHDIALQIPETETISVHQDLADVSLAFTGTLAADFIPKAKRLARDALALFTPEETRGACGHFAKGSQVGAALN